MDGKMKPIPAMHLDADAILLAAMRTAVEHGVPVKALAGNDVAERTIYDLLSGRRGGSSLARAVSLLRRMPEEIQVAAARQILPDIHHALEDATVAPAASLLGGAAHVVTDAAAAMEAMCRAADDGRVTQQEAQHIFESLDALEKSIAEVRAAINSVPPRMKLGS